MILSISHSTTYEFETAPEFGLQQLRLTPKTRNGQEVLSWQTLVEGASVQAQFTDHHRNTVEMISLDPGTQRVSIVSQGRVQTNDVAGVVGPNVGYAPLWLFKRSTPLTEPGTRIRELVRDLGTENESDVEQLHRLSQLIHEAVSYQKGTTDAQTTGEAALSGGAGVCQDHAHIFISAARLIGRPARYVSGYLMLDDRIDQDAAHGWAEAHIAGLGWVGFDVSNQISPDERYVAIATGLDYAEAAPVSGMTVGEAGETMSVSVQVQQ